MHSNEVLNYPPPMNQSKMSTGKKKKIFLKIVHVSVIHKCW